MMPNRVEFSFAKEVTDWIAQQAQTMNISVEVFPGRVSQEGNWLSVPVAIRQGKDAYERAGFLQQIEEAWKMEDHEGVQLLLVPTKAETQTANSNYARIGELMARQHQLLDRMGENGFKDDDVNRHQAIRQEWEETLQEMERLYPQLKNGVA